MKKIALAILLTAMAGIMQADAQLNTQAKSYTYKDTLRVS